MIKAFFIYAYRYSWTWCIKLYKSYMAISIILDVSNMSFDFLLALFLPSFNLKCQITYIYSARLLIFPILLNHCVLVKMSDLFLQVADVKKNIESVQGPDVYPAAQQMLIHQGKVLKDGTTLEENKVSENSFIVIMLSKVIVSLLSVLWKPLCYFFRMAAVLVIFD